MTQLPLDDIVQVVVVRSGPFTRLGLGGYAIARVSR